MARQSHKPGDKPTRTQCWDGACERKRGEPNRHEDPQQSDRQSRIRRALQLPVARASGPRRAFHPARRDRGRGRRPRRGGAGVAWVWIVSRKIPGEHLAAPGGGERGSHAGPPTATSRRAHCSQRPVRAGGCCRVVLRFASHGCGGLGGQGRPLPASRGRRRAAPPLSGRGPALRVRRTGSPRRGSLAGNHQPGRTDPHVPRAGSATRTTGGVETAPRGIAGRPKGPDGGSRVAWARAWARASSCVVRGRR